MQNKLIINCPICDTKLYNSNYSDSRDEFTKVYCIGVDVNHRFEMEFRNKDNYIGYYTIRIDNVIVHSYSGIWKFSPNAITYITIDNQKINIDYYIKPDLENSKKIL